MKHSAAILITCSIFAGCSRNVSIGAELNGSKLYHCPKAEISKLSPGEGGFRFKCTDNTSVYVIYDTSTKKDGSIVRVEIGQPPAAYLPAVAASRDGEDCSSAKQLNRQTGEAPLPLNWIGQPANGRHEIALARPCGALAITIADAE